jgi:hypothetical protein
VLGAYSNESPQLEDPLRLMSTQLFRSFGRRIRMTILQGAVHLAYRFRWDPELIQINVGDLANQVIVNLASKALAAAAEYSAAQFDVASSKARSCSSVRATPDALLEA